MKVKQVICCLLIGGIFSLSAYGMEPYKDIALVQGQDAITYLQQTQGLRVFPGPLLQPHKPITRQELMQLIWDVDGNLGRLSLQEKRFDPLVLAMLVPSSWKEQTLSKVVTKAELADILEAWQKVNQWQPTKGQTLSMSTTPVSRLEAIQAVYAALYGNKVHVNYQLREEQIWQRLLSYYGSSTAFLTEGVLYRQGETYIIGVYPEKMEQMIALFAEMREFVRIKPIRWSYETYTTYMKEVQQVLAVREPMNATGYIIPDFEQERLLCVVPHPVGEKTKQQVAALVGSRHVQFVLLGEKPVKADRDTTVKGSYYAPYAVGITADMERLIRDFEYSLIHG